MKKRFSLFMALILALACLTGVAEEGAQSSLPDLSANAGETPPEKPDGEMNGEIPSEMPEGGAPDGNPPEMPEGGAPDGNPPEAPDGGQGPGGGAPDGGMPGGSMSGAPETYDAVYEITEDTELTGAIESTGTDENAVHVSSGTLTLSDAAVVRSSDDSTGGDNSSFYGVGAAVLATGGTAEITGTIIDTVANGGAGVFAYGDAEVHISDSTIETQQDTSGGIHVAGGGTLYAENLDVVTHGESSAAIRSDRGGGTMVVNGGNYSTTGSGSPAVYVTADISVADANLTASGSEALCLEGRNTVRLSNCNLSGDMADLDQNDNTWTVILYQSMSGDSEIGEGRFEMSGGTLVSNNGGLFYTTNTDSEFVLSGVEITAAEDSEYFLRCTGNANQRGWGSSGSNGANCRFTAIGQQMDGDVVWDSISNLTLYVTSGSVLNGAVIDDESCAGSGGTGSCALYIGADSTWTVTGDSVLTDLYCAGTIADAQGNAVSIVGTDGTVYVEGDSEYTVTVSSYSAECDLSGAGTLTDWAAEA